MRRAAVPVLLACVAAIPSAEAMQVALDRPQLCARADLVVVAEVTGSETRWATGERGGIETEVWLAPRRVVRGDVQGALSVVLMGGEKDGLVEQVEDQPALAADRDYLLFLERGPDGGLVVLGGESGAVPVKVDGQGFGEPVDKALATLGSCK